MAFSVNDNGTWKTVKKLSVYDGAWKAVQAGWINKNGVWTKFYSGTTIVNVTSQNNINLRTLYTNQTGDSSSVAASVIFNINGDIGSASPATAAMVTGTWPAGSEIVINVASGIYVIGAGGNPAFETTYDPATTVSQAGGNAISLSQNVTINNSGTIGGGGGAGGSWLSDGRGGCAVGSINILGGGGAGSVAGNISASGKSICTPVPRAASGTKTTGGIGSYYSFNITVWSYSVNFYYTGGTGGNLGQNGSAFVYDSAAGGRTTGGGGAAGKAIALNGYTATRTGNTPLGAVS